MIRFLLTVVGLAAFAFAVFVAGIIHAIKMLHREAPDLFVEWAKRQKARRAEK